MVDMELGSLGRGFMGMQEKKMRGISDLYAIQVSIYSFSLSLLLFGIIIPFINWSAMAYIRGTFGTLQKCTYVRAKMLNSWP